MNMIGSLKEFFGYNVPLGVCIIVALGAYHFVFKLQEERRKDYETTFNSQAKVIEELNKIIVNRDKRINDLEKIFHNKKR